MQYTPSVQPETKRQLLSRSFALYRAAFFKVILFAFFISAIAFIPRLLMLILNENIFEGMPLYNPKRLWLTLLDVITLLFFIAILWRIQCVSLGLKESLKNDIETAVTKIPFIIGASILQTLIFVLIASTTAGLHAYLHQPGIPLDTHPLTLFIASIPFILQMLLNVYLAVLFYFYLPLILTEDKSILVALTKSAKLVWGHWWETVTVQVTPWFIYLITLIIVKYVAHLNIHIYFTPLHGQTLSATLVHIMIFALFIPLFATTMLVQLRDLEIRKTLHEQTSS